MSNRRVPRSAFRSAMVLLPVILSVAVPGRAQHIVSSTLLASLRSGSLAGTSFPVSFSYDASQAPPQGQVFLQLITFSFTLRGIQFTHSVFQGGQVILRDGKFAPHPSRCGFRQTRPSTTSRSVSAATALSAILTSLETTVPGYWNSRRHQPRSTPRHSPRPSILRPGALAAIFGTGFSS